MAGELKGDVRGDLRGGVCGAGVFGGFHAGKYAGLPGARLAAVYDVDLSRAEALAQTHGGRGFNDVGAFLAAVDVVTVASPADSHADLARAALAAGKPTYVEKPLATTVQDGQALVDLAAKRALVLACGHQERVVFAAMGLMGVAERPLRIESVRRGLPNARNRDVSCVLDLMIHDLDLALQLAAGEAIAAEAEGGFDQLAAEVTFASGLTAAFEASRVAKARERTMRIVYPAGEVRVDFLAPRFENATPHRLNPDFAATPDGRDPLGASVARFLAAVRGEAARPAATGEDGLRALDLALAVEHAAGI